MLRDDLGGELRGIEERKADAATLEHLFEFAQAVPLQVAAEVAVAPTANGRISVEHPSGEFSVALGIDPANPRNVTRAALLRTARLIMRGQVMVPPSIWHKGTTT